MALAHKKTHGLRRFLFVLLVLAAYTAYAIHSYGVENGLAVTGLTWAFFVFATPVADAGFLVAFPIRLVAGFRMLYTQMAVWAFGIALVAFYMVFNAGMFQTTAILQLFHEIIVQPWPLGLILVLSAAGTFISIRFDDEVMDVVVSPDKKSKLKAERTKLFYMLAIFAATFAMYALLLHMTDTEIDIL